MGEDKAHEFGKWWTNGFQYYGILREYPII